MTTSAGAPVVDADGHVLEPADTWLKYLEPSYRDRAIRIAEDEHGYEVLLIDGQPLKTLRGQLGALGGIEMDATRLLTRGQMTYAEGSPAGGYDPVERLRVMDGEGIDVVLLYPTIGICWEGHVTDGGAGDRLHARLQPLARRLLPHRSQAPLPGRAHLAARSRGRGGGDDPRAARRLRGHLPLAGPGRARRPALRRPDLRAVLGDGAGARDADRLSRGRARSAVVPAVAAPRSLRCAVRHRVPGHRRDGGVHADAGRRHVRALSAAASARCWRPAPTGSPPGSTGSITSTGSWHTRRPSAWSRARTSTASA